MQCKEEKDILVCRLSHISFYFKVIGRKQGFFGGFLVQ